LDVASKENVDVLILGAFGCGAFNNPPKIVAKVFKELLSNYSFKTVEFAVFCRDEHVGDNYDVFKDTFEIK